MPELEHLTDEQIVFGSVLMVANKLDSLLERALASTGLTSVQWFMLVIISNLFDQPPTIKELARTLSTSHQNIKQVALRLTEKGLLELRKDTQDRRVTRVCLTESSRSLLADIDTRGEPFIHRVMSGIELSDLAIARKTLQIMQDNIVDMEQADPVPEI